MMSCRRGHGVVRARVGPFRARFGKFIEGDGAGACRLRQLVPELFGEERHHRMQQAQGGIECGENVAPGGECDFAVG